MSDCLFLLGAVQGWERILIEGFGIIVGLTILDVATSVKMSKDKCAELESVMVCIHYYHARD